MDIRAVAKEQDIAVNETDWRESQSAKRLLGENVDAPKNTLVTK